MARKTIAEKDQKIRKILKEKGLTELPKNPKTGKWVTADKKKQIRRSILDRRIFYNCPKCGKPLLFKRLIHEKKCSVCGQRLEWGDLDGMQSVYILARDSSEAAYWAEKYREINGTVYGIDIEKWRLGLKEFPTILFFSFPESKEYGRFMRIASKEAKIMKEVS